MEFGIYKLLDHGQLATIKPFVPNAPFLYPLKIFRKPLDLQMFSGGREKVHWEQMG